MGSGLIWFDRVPPRRWLPELRSYIGSGSAHCERPIKVIYAQKAPRPAVYLWILWYYYHLLPELTCLCYGCYGYAIHTHLFCNPHLAVSAFRAFDISKSNL